MWRKSKKKCAHPINKFIFHLKLVLEWASFAEKLKAFPKISYSCCQVNIIQKKTIELFSFLSLENEFIRWFSSLLNHMNIVCLRLLSEHCIFFLFLGFSFILKLLIWGKTNWGITIKFVIFRKKSIEVRERLLKSFGRKKVIRKRESLIKIYFERYKVWGFSNKTFVICSSDLLFNQSL